MKLERSLALYGLVDHQTDSLDYEHWEHVKDLSRVNDVLHMLNHRWLGEGLRVTPTILDDGLRFRFMGLTAAYSWDATDKCMCDNNWKCGWVEASYRRFLIDVAGGSRLLAHHQALVFKHMQGWLK